MPPAADRRATAAEDFRRSTALVRGLLREARAKEHRRAQAELDRIGGVMATALDEAEAGATSGWDRAREGAWSAARVVAGARAGVPVGRVVAERPLDLAGRVRIGVVDAAQPDPPPVLLPLLGMSHVRIVGDTSHPQVAGLVQTLLLGALTGTGPGQLMVASVDPQLRGAQAPFSGLTRAGDGLLRQPATGRHTVDELMTELFDEHQHIAALVRGAGASSLRELSEQAGHPLRPHRLLVVLDYPEAFSEGAATQLATLMRDGARHGLSVLLQHVDPRPEDPWSRALSVPAEVLNAGGGLGWSAAPHVPIRLDPPPADAEVGRVVERIAKTAAAAAPTLPLADLLEAIPPARGSADGVVVPVGRAGREIVEISLGDPVAQRHNILVTGAVGQGKSNVLQVLVHALAARYAPSDVELYLLDMREGVTFFPLAGEEGVGWLPHARLVGVQADREYALSVLDFLVAQFVPRADALRRYDGTYGTFRAKEAETPMPRLILVIDEFQALFEQHDEIAEQAAAQLEKLVRMGRGFGIHVILASQGVSHMPALGPKAEIVFAQFPTRLALRNSRAESMAALDQHNDEASRLRSRGEAILNHGFGRREDNIRFLTGWAREETIRDIRMAAYRRWRSNREAPSVFDGRRLPDLGELSGELAAMRRGASGRVRKALLGRPVAFAAGAPGAVLAAEPGRHLAIVGAGEIAAVGMLQAAAISLALQHPAGDAEFMVLDMTDNAPMSPFLDLLGRLGFAPEVHTGRTLGMTLGGLADRLPDGIDGTSRYVFGFGLDRAIDAEMPGPDFRTPADALQTLLAQGANAGTHVLGWWSSAAVFTQQRGIRDETMPATLALLRLESRAVMDLAGMSVGWSSPENRALLLAPRDGSPRGTLIPPAPIDRRVVNALLRVDWEH